jgi:hypothetical protein
MWHGRLAEVVMISALATIVTAAIAAPVLRAPSERVFGAEIVGRHHDPFTVMRQFERPLALGGFVQPVTDIPGALLARLSGAVAAYNWLVLLSFPLAAAAAYALARYLSLGAAGASMAAVAYAFSPFHLSHAAYHPHVAQTQWVPLYLLALWRCLDHASPAAILFLSCAAIAVTLSNFYGGLIAAVMTPVAVAASWLTRPADQRSVGRLGVTMATLSLLAGVGVAYAWFVIGPIAVNRTAFAVPHDDLVLHSARWWSYLVPPLQHPMIGDAVGRFWTDAGVREGLLEQQVSLGWGIIGLGIVAVVRWSGSVRASGRPAALIVVVAAAALACSLASASLVAPSGLLYAVVPMFRAYARFGVVVQLMAVLLAGIGVDRLIRAHTRRARIACVALVALAAAEYAVSPSTLWRDVLPTTAHRWMMQQAGEARALDCTPLTQESESVPWLTQNRIAVLNGLIADCSEPNVSDKLAAAGYRHLLVRHDSADRAAYDGDAPPQGFGNVTRFGDARVFEVMAPTPSIYTGMMTGLFPREHDARWTWRWMGATAAWTVVNTSRRPIAATLHLEVQAFPWTRRLEVLFDGRLARTLVVETSPRVLAIGPLRVAPGDHTLMFRSMEVPVVAGHVINNGDWRPLAFAFGTWHWTEGSERP